MPYILFANYLRLLLLLVRQQFKQANTLLREGVTVFKLLTHIRGYSCVIVPPNVVDNDLLSLFFFFNLETGQLLQVM